MEIMLIEDVANLGRVGDIVEVKNGYARNYLIPKKLAVPATAGARKQAEQLRAVADKRLAREVANAREFAGALSQLVLRFERKVGEKGRLYGSVTSGDIAERIEQAVNLVEELDKRKVQLDEPLKTLGNYEVPIFVHPDVPASVRVEILGENGETAADFADEEEVVAEGVVPAAEQPDGEY